MTKTGNGMFSWRQLINGDPLPPSQLRSFLRIKPVLDYKALEPGQAATDAIRAAARELHLAEQYDARVRLTGPVPISNEEFGSVKDGAMVNAVATVVIVLFILWLALHSPKIIVAVFITLAIGLSITTALGLVMVSAFNRSRSRSRCCCRPRRRLRHPVQRTLSRGTVRDRRSAGCPYQGRRIFGGAAVARCCCDRVRPFVPADQLQGRLELGKIAGVGMMVAFVGSITVLPALPADVQPARREPNSVLRRSRRSIHSWNGTGYRSSSQRSDRVARHSCSTF